MLYRLFWPRLGKRLGPNIRIRNRKTSKTFPPFWIFFFFLNQKFRRRANFFSFFPCFVVLKRINRTQGYQSEFSIKEEKFLRFQKLSHYQEVFFIQDFFFLKKYKRIKNWLTDFKNASLNLYKEANHDGKVDLLGLLGNEIFLVTIISQVYLWDIISMLWYTVSFICGGGKNSEDLQLDVSAKIQYVIFYTSAREGRNPVGCPLG